MFQRVHVIFKTHLDVGFTDRAASVIDRYEREFIPKAIRLAETSQGSDGRPRFVWTTGSFLIQHCLSHAPRSTAEDLASAIRRGYIAWHGLPFSMHSELLDKPLFEHALSLAKRLDQQFGRTTIAAKMTDVPGHSLGVVPLLAASGIRYLHLGVNSASPRPRVPKLFVWQARDGAEIVVHYADDYGEEDAPIPALQDALVFAHSTDNQSPPDAQHLHQLYERLQRKYPDAEIFASTLDAFAEAAWAARRTLPTVTEEIGDTWIHGAASDPKKMAEFRELLRLRSQWLAQGIVQACDIEAFSDFLLMVPEHTWGLDHKTFLGDYVHYAKAAFRAARRADRVDVESIPKKYGYLSAFVPDPGNAPLADHPLSPSPPTRSYGSLEASWQEQRQYLIDAVNVLPEDRRIEAQNALQALAARRQDLSGMTPLPLEEAQTLGRFSVRFGTDGAIHSLRDESGREWATARCPIGLFTYQTFGLADYQRWLREYLVHADTTYPWADADFGKPGFEFSSPPPRSHLFVPERVSATGCRGEDADRAVVALKMAPEATEDFGCPRAIEIAFSFLHDTPTLLIAVQWFDKDAVRIPEATWFSLGFEVDNPSRWMLDKLGEPIVPSAVVQQGNRAMHGVGGGIAYRSADGSVQVQTQDAPVVSVGDRHLLNFLRTIPDPAGGFHFNLHNNVWGTNFPAWYGEDAKFRFAVTVRDALG